MAVKLKNMIPEDDPRVAPIGHPAPPWMVNYADLMTEMVCFFIILYALSAALNKNVQNAAQQIKEMMEKGEMAGQVEINKEGLKITLEEQGNLPFFESGKATLTEEMTGNIDKIVPTLKKLSQDYEIIVEGHTDNVPIFTQQFASNWELSTARATSVVKYLIDKGISPKKISAIGYGEFRPVVPNDTPQNRQKNRRVVFFVKTFAGKVKDEKK
ncbi:MAG: flagellar motor protein MotB [Elusimicrobiales bacterium]|nr:flagellar motor protein MotB [Elusimicrobiales bacterium]HOJ86842.1 flagellar motor protein MotB [Elusimicrobiales bacterium]HPO96046.1 flagellar motor protein MotB [Elusimicrobiales bacterium]